AWYEKHGTTGMLADPGHQLDWPDKAKTVRASGVTDGPYMEAKEVLAGYSLLEVAGIDEAVEIARTWPGIDRGWIVMEGGPVMAQYAPGRLQREAAGEQFAFGRVGGQLECPLVRRAGLLQVPEIGEQLGPHGVEQPVAVEVTGQRLDLGQRGPRAEHEPGGDGAVEPHDRGRLQHRQPVIQPPDPAPGARGCRRAVGRGRGPPRWRPGSGRAQAGASPSPGRAAGWPRRSAPGPTGSGPGLPAGPVGPSRRTAWRRGTRAAASAPAVPAPPARPASKHAAAGSAPPPEPRGRGAPGCAPRWPDS